MKEQVLKYFEETFSDWEDLELSEEEENKLEIEFSHPAFLRVNIDFNTMTFDIFFQEAFEDYFEEEVEIFTQRNNYYVQLETIALSQRLFELSGKKPHFDKNSCGYCSEINIFGYFEIEFNLDNLKGYIDLMKNASNNLEAEIDDQLIQKGKINFPEEAEFLKLYHTELLQNELKILKDALRCDFVSFDLPGLLELKEYVFIDKKNNMIVGFSNVDPFSIPRIDKNFNKIDNVFKGEEYFLTKKGENVTSFNLDFINAFKGLIEKLDIYENMSYFSNINNQLLVKTKSIWAIIAPIRSAQASILKEYENLQKQINSFKIFTPKMLKLKCDWSILDEEDFENLCVDFLIKKGFCSVRKVGKTNAPDGGRDIEAEETYNTLIGIEKRKWVFQCKHTKKSVSYKDLYSIRDILDDCNAYGFGLFCSGDITPDTINRFNRFNEKNNKIARYWTGNDLERELELFPELLKKYGLAICFKIETF